MKVDYILGTWVNRYPAAVNEHFPEEECVSIGS